jgi:hypothetical protein
VQGQEKVQYFQLLEPRPVGPFGKALVEQLVQHACIDSFHMKIFNESERKGFNQSRLDRTPR